MGANPTADNSDPQTTDSNETNHSTSNSSSSNSVSQPSATAIKAASKYATSSTPTSTSSNVNTTSAAVKDDTSPVTIMIKNNIASKPIKTNKLDTNGDQEQQQPRKNQNASNDHGDPNSTQAIATNKAGKLSEQQGSSSNHNPNQPLDSTTNNSQGATSSPSIRKNRENNSKIAPMIDAKDGSLEATKELDPNSDANQSGSMGCGGNYRIKKPNSSVEPVSTTSVQNSASMVDSNSTFNGLTNKLRESSSGVGGLKDQQRHQSVRNNNMRSDHGSQMSNQSNYYQQHGKSAPHQHQQQQQHYNNRNHSHQHTNQYHHHYPHQSSHNNQEQLSKTNLYIKGLSPDTNDTDLFALCSQFGNIVSTKAILDKATNKCKGYGFVDFETAEAAEYAVNELHKQGILAHMARQQEADPTNLYIANLPQVMTESELENLLRPYGQVVSTRILVNQHRQPRGVGFARMETKEQCDNIIATLNGQPIKGSEEPLLIKFADGAGKKRNHQYQHRTIGSNVFIGDNLWRNSNNETNSYTVMNSGAVNRNFHGGSFDHARQNHHQAFPQQNDTLMKHHHQMLSNMAGFQHQGTGGPHHQMHSMVHHPAGHNTTGGGHQAAQHQSPMTHHHGPNHSSNSSNHRNQNQSSPYAGGSNFPLSAQIGNSNASSQWIHTSQAHQPYVIQPQILAPTSAIDPSMHYLNLANQMQGLQIGNPAVGGFLSPQQWQVWPGTVGAKHSGPANSTNPGGNHSGYSDVD